jgi:ATP-dependent helicase/nuclease subunit B
MARPAASPNVSTIPPNLPFVDTLAADLLARTADDPLALADYVVLLPTRRACRALADAFLRNSDGDALLLPGLRPIGDVDDEELAIAGDQTGGESGNGAAALDLPPAISDLRRRILLSRLVLGQRDAGGGPAMTVDQASWLAAELARLIDQAHTEGIDFTRLPEIVPEELAEHWQQTVTFLEIVTRAWPEQLAAEGAIDPADRRNRMIRAQADAWRAAPPDHPVIAAGSTGTIPATADLLAVVARLPRGEVVLPGLDQELDDDSWAAAADTASHPQYGLARLLERLEVARDDVRAWEAPDARRHRIAPAARMQLVSEAFRPAATSHRWAAPELKPEAAFHALQQPTPVFLSESRAPREEAGAIAVALRQQLNVAGATAALITANRDLARRVAVAMRRWGIEIDDSAGQPLGRSAPAVFLVLLARMVSDEFAPVPFLSALKHPLAAGGMDRGRFLARVRGIEAKALRGPRPAAGLAGIARALRATREDAGSRDSDLRIDDELALLDRLDGILAPLANAMAVGEARLPDLLQAHMTAAEALAASDDTTGPARLWAGDDGEAVARFVDELMEAGAELPLPPAQYPALLEALMVGRVLRPRYGTHPRLAILGPLEARLQHFDLVILGSLNEGDWPAAPPADPWMSRSMRDALGLLPVDRRVGLAAHDVAQALCAPAVILTRSQRAGGSPTVPSRWLLRLDTVLRALGLTGDDAGDLALDWRSDELNHLYEALDRPDAVAPAARPVPRPPVAARPRQLSVTRIERWRRNPYEIYAQRILRLRALEDLDAPPGARDRGNFIHDAIDRFMKAQTGGDLAEDALQALLDEGRRAFDRALDSPVVRAFWWPRFRQIAEWFIGEERDRRAAGVRTLTEVDGRLTLPGGAGAFELTAKADRLDLTADGLEISDYKTGRTPDARDIARGYAPQLPLEAVIALDGTFDGLDASAFNAVSALFYWRLAGGTPAGEVRSAVPGRITLDDLIDEARDGLTRLVHAFDNPETPYACRPKPAFAPGFDDYEHLARVREWSSPASGDGE